MKSQYSYDDLALINYYFYQVFAPDLQIGHVMDPAKKSQAFTFLSGSLALARNGSSFPEEEFDRLLKIFPDMADFVRSSPIPFCSPVCGPLPMKIFSDAFEIVLDSDFAQIFRTNLVWIKLQESLLFVMKSWLHGLMSLYPMVSSLVSLRKITLKSCFTPTLTLVQLI